MSDQNSQPKGSILSQVQGELKAQRIKAAKGELKALLTEYNAATAVRDAIEAKIIALVESTGEDASGIAELLAD